MKKINLIIATFIILVQGANAQNLKYAREIIDTLCSPYFAGRGYAYNHDGKAAQYLQNEMAKQGLRKFGKTYNQKFRINTNVILGDCDLILDDDTLNAGRDFLVRANSASVKGDFPVVNINAGLIKNKRLFDNIMQQDFKNKVLIIDTIGLNQPNFKTVYDRYFSDNQINAKVVVRVTDKGLLHVPAVSKKKYTEIILRKDAFPKVVSKAVLNIKTKFLKHEKTQNLIGYIEGKTDSFIVFTAHYDHIGMMGNDAYFPGAHDNASGTAMVLDLARYYHAQKEKPNYSTAFILFSGEEIGLKGSLYYVEHPLFPLSKIKFLVNLDIVGSGDEGIKIVNGSVFKSQFQILSDINAEHNYLPAVKSRGAAANSDHYPFYAKSVPSFFIYTLGTYKEYHNIYDRADKVPLSGYEYLFKLLIEFGEKI